MTIGSFGLIFAGVMLNAGAQLLLKRGMCAFEGLTAARLVKHFWPICSNLYVIGGIGCYVLSVLIWLMVLSRVAVSVAYPLLSMGYIVTAIAGYYLFQENVSMLRIAGILIIMVGVVLVSKST